MSDRFVSGGVIGSSNEPSSEGGAPTSDERAAAQPAPPGKNSAEWEAVQKQLEAERQRREEQRRKAVEGEEKSLYDILQENKAAKQAAFEEKSKVQNQFRALDDDEIEFLDEVRERKRMEEERVKRETQEGLKAFRERQKGGEQGVGGGEVEESWEIGRKRKRMKEKDIKGVRRRVSEADGAKESGQKGNEVVADQREEEKGDETKANTENPKQASPKAEAKKPGLALVDYGSDDSG